MNKKYSNIGDPITNLIEELAELIYALCKAKRFGFENWHPDDKEKVPNWKLIENEIMDVKKRIADLKFSALWRMVVRKP